MNKLAKVFQYGEKEVRTVVINNEPWFVAKDVCVVLEISDARKSVNLLDEDERNIIPVTDSLGRNQDTFIINEPGLYSLVMKSRKPEAKQFKRWITHEVLPTIRKHGAYMTDDALEKTLQDPDYIIGVISALKDEKQKRIAAEQTVEKQKPKVLFADAVETSKASILIGELAKLLKQNGVEIGQKRLFDWLRDNGYLIKRIGDEYNNPTQKSMELGLFEIKKSTINNPDGSVRVTKTSKVTGKGQIYFINKFLKEKAVS
jgi:anti-repressor protein